jgi:hypothetical protein
MSFLKRYKYEQNYKRQAPNKQTQLLAFADEINIVGRSSETVLDAYLALEAETVKIGMKINEQKTKYMIAAGNRTILDNEQIVAFGNKNFEVVNEFLNLGALVTPKNDVGVEIQQRIENANRCFCSLRKYLRSYHRHIIHRLVVLYGSKTWVLIKREKNRLLVFEESSPYDIWPQKS